jgi:OPT oligopeptide transporter protein
VDHRVQAISIAAVVAVATANAGNTSQDLKTGFLVGATPRRQQIAILVGALGSALVVGWTLTLLNRAYTYPVPETHPAFSAQALAPPTSGAGGGGGGGGGGGRAAVEVLPETMTGFRIAASDSVDHATYQVVRVYVVTEGVAAGKYLMDPATHELRYVVDPGIGGRIHEYHGRTIPRLDSPKATIMALIADGILTHKLPWVLVLLGVFITIAIELMGVQALPVAVGVYLPISTSSAMFAGGVVRWLIERRAQAQQQSIAEVESGPGVLFASGLIAGGAICGIVLAAIAGVLGSADALAEKAPLFHALGGLARSNLLAFGLFAALGALLYRIGRQQQ